MAENNNNSFKRARCSELDDSELTDSSEYNKDGENEAQAFQPAKRTAVTRKRKISNTPDNVRFISHEVPKNITLVRQSTGFIETSGVARYLITEIPSSSYVYNNAITLIQSRQNHFSYREPDGSRRQDEETTSRGGYVIMSLIHSVVGSNIPSVRREGLVFPFYTPLPPNISNLRVKWGKEITYGKMECEWLNDIIGQGYRTREKLQKSLKDVWRLNDSSWVSEISYLVYHNLEYVRNDGLYAKLFYYSMLIDLYTTAGIVPVALSYPKDQNIKVINVAEDPVDHHLFSRCYVQGYIFFQLDGYLTSDIDNVLLWLAYGGRRIASPEGQSTPAAAWLEWPPVGIAVLKHGPATTIPEPAVPTAAMLISFAQQMAWYRKEHAALVRGLYMAMDLIGARYSTVDGVTKGHFANFQLDAWELPMPRDYSFIFRSLRNFPNETTKDSNFGKYIYGTTSIPSAIRCLAPTSIILDEIHYYFTYETTQRLNLVAAYSALMSVFATTQLYSMKISTGDLLNGVDMPIPLDNYQNAIQYYTGWDVCLDSYNRTLEFRPEDQAGATIAFREYSRYLAPSAINPLSVDCLLLKRPLEWGVLGCYTKIELPPIYALNAFLRCNSYPEQDDKLCTGFVPYVVQLVNAVHQALCLDTPCGDENAVNESVYDEDLFIYRPCTYPSWMSNSMGDAEFPFTRKDALTPDQLAILAKWKGTLVYNVGFVHPPSIGCM